LEWDVQTWSHALRLWETHLPGRLEGLNGLEIGARGGGLSLYLALKGAHMICSDLHNPEKAARPLHQRFQVEHAVEYQALNALELPFADHSLDLIACKSVLGGLKRNSTQDHKRTALREIQRVLKPGGYLLLAENLRGNAAHLWLRQRFQAWGQYWEYLPWEELPEMLRPLEIVALEAHGISALVGRSEKQRQWLARLDQRLEKWLPPATRYMACALARQPQEVKVQ
jgi:ubiquinone/menaquinone biosynthesis C-methylase UbiE